jgi:hypothetical protein
MKVVFFLLLGFPILSHSQVNPFKAYKTVLQHAQVGKEYSFDKSRKDDLDSLVVVYLGKIITTKGRVLKLLTSRWYWGSAPRATSRIIVFNEKNQYLGDYYLTMTYDVPDKIEDKSLVFINDMDNNCTPNLTTRVSFRNGIPKQFFVKCKGEMGDIYSFAQNL